MAENTKIEWADRTWSPWIGCQKVSPACDGCYAEHLMDTRMGRVEWGPHGERKRTSAPYWRQPLAWNRAAAEAGRVERVFPSLCDPFDNQVDPAWRRDFFDLIRATPHLQWLLLTKRPQNIVAMCGAAGGLPGNAALGTTCEDQKRADINVPALLSAKRLLGCRIAFLSCEPLLGPIDLTVFPRAAGIIDKARPGFEKVRQFWFNALSGEDGVVLRDGTVLNTDPGEVPSLDWVITGGETDQGKHKARSSHPDWFRQIRDACAAAGVPYLHKQNGEWVDADSLPSETLESYDVRGLTADGVARVGKKRSGRLLDGVEHNGFPDSGRVPLSGEGSR